VTEKACTRCGGRFPLDGFNRNPRMRSGWSSWCRRCQNEATRAWRERNRAAYNERRRLEYAERNGKTRERTCSECGEEFTGRPDRQTCSPECRKRRKARKDTRWPKAA
jgi:hypothetical protein